MKVLITGGAGFLGLKLAQELCRLGALSTEHCAQEPIEQVVLFDRVPADLHGLDPRIQCMVGDIANAADIARVVKGGIHSIFHLAAVVSGQAEQDFDLGMQVNVDASRLLLEAARQMGSRPRVIFTSSVAVYGGKLPALVTDETALLPKSSYGVQKAIAELLLLDYSRKRFVDGRVARLPTITVRPGKPNQAASSFVSAIIREPLNAESANCPVLPDTPLWISSPETAIQNLVHLHEAHENALEDGRVINFPGLCVTAQQMVDALQTRFGVACAQRVGWAFDQRIQNIVGTWPRAWDSTRALALGMTNDPDIQHVIMAYADSLKPAPEGTTT